MRRSRKLLGMGAAAAGVAAITVPVAFALADTGSGSGGQTPTAESPSGEVSCDIEELPAVEDGSNGMATAVSPDGKYIVGDEGIDPVIWKDGSVEKLPEDLGSVVDVNSSGDVIGTAENMDGEAKSYVYRGGELEELVDSEGDPVEATGINEDGAISANGGTRDEEMLPPTSPVKFEPGETEGTELELSDDLIGETTGISDDGSVVGAQYEDSEEDDSPDRPWIWDADGKGTEMAKAKKGVAPDQVRGDWAISAGEKSSYRWNIEDPSKVEKLDQPKGLEASTFDADNRAFGTTEGDSMSLPAAQNGDKITELPVLVEEPDGEASSSNITDVSDDGSVVVGDTIKKDDHDNNGSAVWNCS